jgi:hypothetical protein
MSSVTKTVLIVVKQQGLDQVNTAIKGLTSTSQTATKATNGLGQAFAKGQGDTLKLRTGVMNLDKAEVKATKSVTTFGKSADAAGKSTSGLAAKFQGNKGLIFSTVGIATAGLEAVGMFQQFQNAQAKVSEATARLNTLEAAGLQHTSAYTDAQRDLTDANRGLQFAFRILALSVGDLIPFSLLLINSLVKLKDTVSSGAKPAIDAVAKSTTAFGTAATATSTGGLRGFFNSLTQGLTGTKNLDTGLKTVSTTTGTFNNALGNLQTGFTNTNTKVLDATRLVGTGNNGLVGGISGLSVQMDKSNKMSSKFKDAFAKIGTSIKSLPSTFKNIGSSVASFFTNFGSNIGKFGGMLKTAGAAVMTFSKTMLLAFLSNPITAAIAGISAAVLALATDFGGIRTAANNFGVALGNAIPAARGILQAIGDAANGALDAVAGFLGLQKEVKNTGTVAEQSAKQFAPLKQAITDTVQVSGTIGTLRMEIDKLHNGVDVFTKNSIIGLNGFKTSVVNALTPTQKQIPAVKAVLAELDATIVKTSADGYDLGKAKAELNAVLTKLQTVLLGTTTGANKEAAALIESGKASKTVEASTGGLAKSKADLKAQVIQLNAELKLENQVVGDLSKKQAEARQQVAGWLNDMGMATTATETQKASLLANAASLQMYGDKVVFAKDGNIDLAKTLQLVTKENQVFEQVGTKAFGAYAAMVNKLGTDALPLVQTMLEDLKNKHPEIGAVAEKLWKDYLDNTVDVQGQLMLVNEAEEEQAKAVKSTGDSVAEKAKKLGILNKIQGLSLQDQQNAIKITEQQNKVENQSRLILQQLAVARGLDTEQIGISNKSLFEHIAANNKVVVSIDDVLAATGQLLDARRNDAKEAEIQRQAQEQLLATMGEVPPVLGMTGKGLESLVKLYDETANATGIAADQVGTWWAELQKSQKVEDATITKLEELAKSLGITIPDSIKKEGIPAIEEYISKVTGIGPAAKKAAEEAKKAFNDMANEASGAIQDMIKEDVLAGKGKKVVKTLEEIGLAADSLAGKQAIIEVGANTIDFTDKISSIPELVISMLEGIPPQTTEQANQIITAFADSMESELGNRIPGIGATIESVWDYVKNTAKPSESAAQMVERFRNEIMKDPALFAKAAQTGIVDPLTGQITTGLDGLPTIAGSKADAIAQALGGKVQTFSDTGEQLAGGIEQGFVSGSHVFPDAGKKAYYELIKPGDPAKAEAYAKANEIAGQTEKGFTAGAGHIMTAGEQAMYNLLAPYGKAAQDAYAKSLEIADKTKQGVDTIPGKTESSLAPVPGIFSQAFVDASAQAGTQLSGILTKVQTTMSNMSTSVATYSQSMNVNFATAIQNMGIPLLPFGEAIYALMGVLSTLSTSVATYSTSMATNITTFVSTSIAQLVTLSDYINATMISTLQLLMETVGTVMTTMTTAIGAWITASIKSMGELIKVIQTTQKTFSTMSTSVATYMNSMKTNIANFAKGATTSFGQAANGTKTFHTAASKLSTSVATYSKSMASNLKSFSSSAVSSLKAVTSAANKATSALKAMAQAAAKAKAARSGLRFGGAFVMGGQAMNQSSFAQTGKSWINSRPRKIGGVNISEFSKPELVTVTPLSNPSDPMDKGLSYLDKLPAPKLQMPNVASTNTSNRGTNQPINVNLHTTITMPDGKVLAKAVQQHLLSGFSGIT